jgi:hypothetical protein
LNDWRGTSVHVSETGCGGRVRGGRKGGEEEEEEERW